MLWSVRPTLQRVIPTPPLSARYICLLGLCTVLLSLNSCFMFRSKPNSKAQEMTNRLSPGLTTDEVLALVGPPQRQGQNLFDKKKEYWIYEFAAPQKKKRKTPPRDTDGTPPDTTVVSELQLLFERGKLVNWNVVPVKP
jgi:outer membrane protein assembly factor BamE (lipoprotein component of BamABCDE complex)